MTDFNDKRNRPNRTGNKGDGPKEPSLWRGPGKSLLFWLGLFLVIFVIYTYYSSFNQDTVEIIYTEFTAEIDNGNVMEVIFTDREVEGKLREAKAFASSNLTGTFTKFKSRIPLDDNYELIKLVQSVYPYILGTNGDIVQVRIGTQQYDSDPISWTEPQDFIIGQTDRINITEAGRLISLSITGDMDRAWRCYSVDFNYNMSGKY